MNNNDEINKLFLQFKGKNVSVDLRDDNRSEGKVIAVDNYLNLVLETENGLETIKCGNVVLVSLKD
ncbi:LSM domain-containing protein [Methanobrevibacter smithii]|uniref:LSM domain-containing protein n=1 Tax=Methanobrevibacter smithii TaxID=2173 RepID=UPI001C017F92|nr:LSM domain-containing protein [Methanobrevibacter smithii]MBT9657570.1 LSM domain protein [Methanobrevibacter smithii]